MCVELIQSDIVSPGEVGYFSLQHCCESMVANRGLLTGLVKFETAVILSHLMDCESFGYIFDGLHHYDRD